MKTLTKYLNERLVVNKDYNDPHTCAPKSLLELRKIIIARYNKLGPGTKQKPIDFNDVDVSNIDSFYDSHDSHTYNGIFVKTKFEYIDISKWNVSNVKSMRQMFCWCEQLKSVGDLSNWSVSKVENMYAMFYGCAQLKSIGNISNWDVSNVEYMGSMFYECEELTSVGDLSKWNILNVEDMYTMFYDSGITNIPDWY